MWSSLLYQLSLHYVAFSFTWASDLSEADVGVGDQGSDNFMEYWTQVVSDKHINVYTMRAARGILPVMAYTGRLRPKGVPFIQALVIWKGRDFTS